MADYSDLLNMNIYDEVEYEILKKRDDGLYIVNKSEKVINLWRSLYNNIISYCNVCNQELSFSPSLLFLDEDIDKKELQITNPYLGVYNNSSYQSLKLEEILDFRYALFRINTFEVILILSHFCTHNKNHFYHSYFKAIFTNGVLKLIKIGQFPSNGEFIPNNSRIYMKQLKMFNSLQDYKNSLISDKSNLHVASSLYLRRIFEKIVDYYLNQIGDVDKTVRMEEKIHKIKEYLDPDIAEIAKSSYELLSTSVHNLTEEESKLLYSTLKEFVDFQLLFEFNKDLSLQQKAQLKKSIHELNQKHK